MLGIVIRVKLKTRAEKRRGRKLTPERKRENTGKYQMKLESNIYAKAGHVKSAGRKKRRD